MGEFVKGGSEIVGRRLQNAIGKLQEARDGTGKI